MNIYKIAELSGVSVSAVSRVINGKDGIGDATREKILQVIKENNFQPKVTKNNHDTIAVIVNMVSNPLSNPYIVGVLSGISEAVFDNQYSFMVVPMSRISKTKNSFKSFCTKHKITGAIFVNLTIMDKFISEFSDVVPIVTVGSDFLNNDIISVRSKNIEGSREAVEYLIDCGHKDIAFFVPDMNYQDHNDRYLGYLEAMKKHNSEIKDSLIVKYDYNDFSASDLEFAIDSMFSSENGRPTAMFICDDMEALKILSILKKKGISVPEDISVIGFDDYEFSKHFTPPLTTVKQPLNDLGKLAVESIIAKISGKSYQKNIVVDTRLIIRKTVNNI